MSRIFLPVITDYETCFCNTFLTIFYFFFIGKPKPFKFTEIQRHRFVYLVPHFGCNNNINICLILLQYFRFNLTDKEGSADRKVPVQPLAFTNKEGVITRYNLRKVRFILFPSILRFAIQNCDFGKNVFYYVILSVLRV